MLISLVVDQVKHQVKHQVESTATSAVHGHHVLYGISTFYVVSTQECCGVYPVPVGPGCLSCSEETSIAGWRPFAAVTCTSCCLPASYVHCLPSALHSPPYDLRLPTSRRYHIALKYLGCNDNGATILYWSHAAWAKSEQVR